ncbi:MAG: GNAT family N-acetyltransferase [Chloroflexi bacterium]|nr:GNAT family N-acetyltransferase [Chloroflexota bacterium]
MPRSSSLVKCYTAAVDAGIPKIRLAMAADVPQLALLWLESAEYHARLAPEYYELSAGAHDRVEALLRGGLSGVGRVTLLVEMDREVTGFVQLEISEVAVFRRSRRGNVYNLSVAGRFRRRGLARQLMAAAIEWFRRERVQIVQLNVADANQPALGLYEDLGFKIVNRNLCRVLDG